MSRISILLHILFIFISEVISAQTMNIHLNNNTTIKYETNNLDSVNFVFIPASDKNSIPSGLSGVDLGLPSGKLWANMNLGAEQPEDDGLYFAWGETTGYASDSDYNRSFDWSDYLLCNGYTNTLKKYCTYTSNGFIFGTVDNKTVLDTCDDAAFALWGYSWEMPTVEDYYELLAHCTWKWITQNGVKGTKFISKKNGNSIFFPAIGCLDKKTTSNRGSNGYYWTATLFYNRPDLAQAFSVYSQNAEVIKASRYFGFPIRPVSSNYSSTQVTEIINKKSNKLRFAAKEIDRIDFSKEGQETIVKIPSAVDMGLPSGTKWANMNLGAECPEECGLYYAWGDTIGHLKDFRDGYIFNFENYKWIGFINKEPDYIISISLSKYFKTANNETLLEPEDDAAFSALSKGWAIPSAEDYKELLSNCSSEWIVFNGVMGRKFTSKTNGNSIFFPAAGFRIYSSLYRYNLSGYYLTSSLYDTYNAFVFYCSSSEKKVDSSGRFLGQPIRPIYKEQKNY